jgi:hypothetical protein
MTTAFKPNVAHPAHVFPWVHELMFSTVKCVSLRTESAENVMTLAQHQQNNAYCIVMDYLKPA